MTAKTYHGARRWLAAASIASLTLSPIYVLDNRPTPPALAVAADHRVVTYRVAMMTSIEESPDTVGIADSDISRLSSRDAVDKQLDMIVAMGVTNIQVGLFWRQIEPKKGEFDWDSTDYLIEAANQRGLAVLGVLTETPGWATNSLPMNGMPDATAFGDYAAAIADRYKDKISTIAVWNEPNAAFFLNPVSPAAYTDLLKEAYTRIKAVSPTTTVLGGTLGSGRTIGALTMSPVEFLKGMYAAGAQGYFDALAYHPYKYDMPFSVGGSQSQSPIQQLDALRQLMDANGDEALKIWATEYGIPTSPGGYSALYQARLISDFLQTWSKMEGNGPVFIYSTRDIKTGVFNDEYNFGLYYSNGQPKPAVQVITDFLNGIVTVLPAEASGPIVKLVNFMLDAVARIGRVAFNLVGSVVRIANIALRNVLTAVCRCAPAQQEKTEPAEVEAANDAVSETNSEPALAAATSTQSSRHDTADSTQPDVESPIATADSAEAVAPETAPDSIETVATTAAETPEAQTTTAAEAEPEPTGDAVSEVSEPTEAPVVRPATVADEKADEKAAEKAGEKADHEPEPDKAAPNGTATTAGKAPDSPASTASAAATEDAAGKVTKPFRKKPRPGVADRRTHDDAKPETAADATQGKAEANEKSGAAS